MAEKAKDAVDEDLESPEVKEGETREFWRFVERNGDRVYFEVFAWSGDAYRLCLSCDQYRKEPILGQFVDPKTLHCIAAAWPQGEGQFGNWFKWQPEHLFICWPADRGGLARHGEWRSQELWKASKNPIHQYLEFIRKCLNVKAFGYKSCQSPATA